MNEIPSLFRALREVLKKLVQRAKKVTKTILSTRAEAQSKYGAVGVIGADRMVEVAYYADLKKELMADSITARPTKEDLARLPKWALVAYATRCARRIQHIGRQCHYSTSEGVLAVEIAISAAELSASTGRVSASLPAAIHAANKVAEAADCAAYWDDDISAFSTGSDAEIAARCAAAAARVAKESNADARIADTVYVTACVNEQDAIADYNMVLAFAQQQRCSEDTPFDVKRIGSL